MKHWVLAVDSRLVHGMFIMLIFIIRQISDWLIALMLVSLVIWFVFTQPVFFISKNNALQPSVSQNNLKQHVNQLSQIYAPRTVSYNNLASTARYIHSRFTKFGQAQYQPYWTLNGQFNNVILQIGPDTDEIFVIGAHYDAEDSSLDTEGNASGIATLIELARHLAMNEDKLSIRVQLVAYPLSQSQSNRQFEMGSYNHADALRQSNKKVKMMISLDSVGRFNSEQGSQQHPFSFMKFFYPNKGDYISLMGRLQDYSAMRDVKNSFASASSLPLYSFNAPENFPKISSSDHHHYWKQGYPALLVTDTAEYRNVNDASLEVAERLDYKKMALLVQGLYQVVMDSESRPSHTQLVQHEQTDVKDLYLNQ